ncbi:hypothetical protein HY641_03595 [Candidatus Woesearchaeota archaeon]|nr:hypothetical protein [Candidatus Woesearchaeota archaeon]
MRKAIALSLIAVLGLMLLASCGRKETTEPPTVVEEPSKPGAQPATPAKPGEQAATPAEPAVPAKKAEADLGISDSDLDIGDNPDMGYDEDVDMSVE